MFDRLTAVLWNGRERRPRAPLRLVVAIVVLVVVLLLAATAIAPILGRLGVPRGGRVALVAASAIVSATTVPPVVYLVGRFVDRRRFRDFGLALDRAWWIDLGFGLGLGAALMTGIFLVEFAAGWIRVTGVLVTTAPVSLLPWLALTLVAIPAAAVAEELLVRGYLLTNLAEGLVGAVGTRRAVWIATLLSAGLFGLGHAPNPNATIVSTAIITLAGVLLALGYVLTGDLAIPIGLHVSWNLFQGSVYGFPVSGAVLGASLVGIEQRGPALATGGPFGPEAGLAGAVAVLAGKAAIVAWVRARGGAAGVDPGIVEPDLRWRD